MSCLDIALLTIFLTKKGINCDKEMSSQKLRELVSGVEGLPLFLKELLKFLLNFTQIAAPQVYFAKYSYLKPSISSSSAPEGGKTLRMNGNILTKQQPYLIVSATPIIIVDPETSLLFFIHRNYMSSTPSIVTVIGIKIITWLKQCSEIDVRGHLQSMLKRLIFEEVSNLVKE